MLAIHLSLDSFEALEAPTQEIWDPSHAFQARFGDEFWPRRNPLKLLQFPDFQRR
jgi:hypothetical protein